MSMKSDLLLGGLIIGGLALAGYAGYRVIGNLTSGGGLDLASLLGLGSGAGDTDVFGNATVASIERKWSQAYNSDTNAMVEIEQSKKAIQEYDLGNIRERMYLDYIKEYEDYTAVLEQWRTGKFPKYDFWTGRENAETTALRIILEREAAEANAASERYYENYGNAPSKIYSM